MGAAAGRGLRTGGAATGRRALAAVLALATAPLVVLAVGWAAGVGGAPEGTPATGVDAYAQAEESALAGVEAAKVQVAAHPSPSLYDGGSDDSGWSVARGGKALGGSAAVGVSAEVGIEYVGADGETGEPRYRARAVGDHNGARRAHEATFRYTGGGTRGGRRG